MTHPVLSDTIFLVLLPSETTGLWPFFRRNGYGIHNHIEGQIRPGSALWRTYFIGISDAAFVCESSLTNGRPIRRLTVRNKVELRAADSTAVGANRHIYEYMVGMG